jgi:hypothetical protein
VGPCIFVLPYACSSRIHFGVEALTLCANIGEYSWQAEIKDGSGAFLALMSHHFCKTPQFSLTLNALRMLAAQRCSLPIGGDTSASLEFVTNP